MSRDQKEELSEKLKAEGFDLENCTTEEKVLYVWKLYLTSEVSNSWSSLSQWFDSN